ncbi:MAG: hypothetical protein MZW92_78345 [Comamonadaceae bacterium]|nr:hypothetical protein [Comamonadaceae bacterium]
MQLVYVCSPGNPTGKVHDAGRLEAACSSCPTATASSSPPTSATRRSTSTKARRRWARLQAAQRLGRDDYQRPGRVLQPVQALQRAGHALRLRRRRRARSLERFLLYRTYHGCAMNPAVQAASVAAWNDEAHVAENRRLYREKFAAVTPLVARRAADRRSPTPASTCGRARRRRRCRLRPRACYARL